jgi:hypothetical protein
MKARKRQMLQLITLSFLILTFSGCQKDDSRAELNEMLRSMKPISDAFPAEKVATVENTAEEKDSEYFYKIDYYSVAAGYDEQIVLNPQTDVIYPGALIKGESILDGSYVPISAKRRPITISTSLTGGAKVFIEVNEPRLSSIRTAINSLMNQNYDVPPANMGFSIEQAYSETQLKLSLRASYSGVVDVSGGFDFSNKKIKTRLVAKFIQNYYTIDMDLPASPADLFEGSPAAAVFGTYMPMYISSVTYGRMALFTIESELSESEVRSYLQGAYASINASASADFNTLSASSTMKVYVLGGSGADAGMTVDGFDAFKAYIKSGGNFSKESPGAPVSYKLRYISDNTIGRIVFAASYPIRTAIPRTDNIRYDVDVYYYQLKTHVDDWGTYCEMRGYIYSYVKGNQSTTSHQHFSAIDMPEYGESSFPTNNTTKCTKTSLLLSDTIILDIHIWEDNDFSFPVSHHEFGVSNIVMNAIGQVYDTKDELKLFATGHGDKYYVIPRFKLTYRQYRVSD